MRRLLSRLISVASSNMRSGAKINAVATIVAQEYNPVSASRSLRFEVHMIAEVKMQYRGVICIHCHQPIPLSASAELKQLQFNEHGPSDMGDFSVFSITLRCRVCHGEGIYTHSDVIDLDGTPRKRSTQANKNPQKHSRSMSIDLPDLAKPTAGS